VTTEGKHLYDTVFYDQLRADSLASAHAVVPVLLEMYQPTSVVDFGCGEGAWLSVFVQRGVTDVFGLDGSYVRRERLLFDQTKFRPLDLADVKPLGRVFDLALCLEVVEHLHPTSADRLIAELVQCAPVVLFSAAVPGQGGTHHVNEQYLEYWIQRFQQRGFEPLDLLRPRIAYDHRVTWWYRQNLILFAAPERARRFGEEHLGPRGEDVRQEWVHVSALFGLLTLKQTLLRIPRATIEAVRHRLRRLLAR